MDRYFSCFLDDIKVFEPSEEVNLTVQMTVRCYRWCKRMKLHIDFPVWFGHNSRQKITENPTPHTVYLNITLWKTKQALNRQRKKLNTNACSRKRPRKKLNTKACGKIIKKDKTTQINMRVKWKMAALIRQANNWNQLARWKRWWKWWRKTKEKEGWKKSITHTPACARTCASPDQKTYMVIKCLWQHAMWQRLETRNPCTQYKPHNDANSHWAIDAHEVAI